MSFEHQQAAAAATMQKIGSDNRLMIPARVVLYVLLLFNSSFSRILMQSFSNIFGDSTLSLRLWLVKIAWGLSLL
jgi:hypothetical protein